MRMLLQVNRAVFIGSRLSHHASHAYSVICLASAAATRLLSTTGPTLQPVRILADVILPAILSLAAAAAVHHAPVLGRLEAVDAGAAAVAARVAAAAVMAAAVKSIWNSCGASPGGVMWGGRAISCSAAVASCCYALAGVLHVDSAASSGGTPTLALIPARVLLLQLLLALLSCVLQPSRDSLCTALGALLFLAGVVSGCVLVYAGIALVMAATFKLYIICSRRGGSLSVGSKASSFGFGCHAWTLAVICWYGTGHAPQFSSLRVSSGFAFVASFNWYICGASLFFETFAPVFVWAM